MAIITDIAAGNMPVVFAGGLAAIVTTLAVICTWRVVKTSCKPAACAMAFLTVVATDKVRSVFAGYFYVVVAAYATAANMIVIDFCDCIPDIRQMAGITGFTRHDMSR